MQFPLQGLLGNVKYFTPTDGRALFRTACLALLATLGVLATVHWRRSNAPLHERLAFIIALGVVIMQSGFSWVDATSFLRHGTEYWVLGVLTVLRVKNMRALGVLVHRLPDSGWSPPQSGCVSASWVRRWDARTSR